METFQMSRELVRTNGNGPVLPAVIAEAGEELLNGLSSASLHKSEIRAPGQHTLKQRASS
jgi:hypothetical protein